MDVCNLISSSSAFAQFSLYIWKFSVHVLLKPSLKDFDHYLASMWNEHSCTIVWTFFDILCLSLGLEWKLTFSSPVATAEFLKNCWHIECSTLTASSFRIWNSSAGIPSPPVALFIVMLPKAHLTSHSEMSGCRWLITPFWLSRSLRSFLSIGMGEFNSDDHYIYYCGKESLRRNGVAHFIKRVQQKSQQKSPKCSSWVQSQK